MRDPDIEKKLHDQSESVAGRAVRIPLCGGANTCGANAKGDRGSPRIDNDSLGLAIDCETATAHWHGERIDYDHAVMIAMASWDSDDTRPEAEDWNSS